MESITEARGVTQKSFSVLIADDHAYVRTWLQSELGKHFPNLTRILEANTPQDCVKQAIAQKPDIIYLDITFEGEELNGIDASKQIWQQHPDASIIILTNWDSELYVKELLSATPPSGAYGYVLKNKVHQCLVEATEAVLEGDCWVDPEVTRIASRLSRKGHSLTDGELEALLCASLGLSDEAISKLLHLTDRAINARMAKIYSKFAIPPRGSEGSATYNPRCRSVWLALKRGMITEPELASMAETLNKESKKRGLDLNL